MRILYLLLNTAPDETLREIASGAIPSDRMYGLFELRQLGHDVTCQCMRPTGALQKVFKPLNDRFGFCLPDLGVLRKLKQYDVIVVNGPFSTLVTIAAKLQKKKLVYLDTILRLPKSAIRKMIYRCNVLLSSGTIMYTKTQTRQCAESLNVDCNRFKLIPFAIDFSYCKKFKKELDAKREPFILAVGRDLGRDYNTLVQAAEGLNVGVKIVTLPYLLQGVTINSDRIEILGNVSYERLYELYSEAAFVVIPLRKWATAYSSGTRALLEAMAMGKCVIATHSPPLEEYAAEGEGILYVEPEDHRDLRGKMQLLLNDPSLLKRIETRGNESSRERYDIRNFARTFSDYLSELHAG